MTANKPLPSNRDGIDVDTERLLERFPSLQLHLYEVVSSADCLSFDKTEFCFTAEFSLKSRRDWARLVTDLGAYALDDSLAATTNFLIIGDKYPVNMRWQDAMSKISTAWQWRARGRDIHLLFESELAKGVAGRPSR